MDYTRADIAGFYWLALAANQISATAVVAWADQEILRSEVTDTALMDLSLSLQRPFGELLSILNAMKQGATVVPSKLFAAFLSEQLRLEIICEAKAANFLHALSLNDAYAGQSLGNEIFCFDELFEPYSMGPKRAAQHVRDFLRPYESVELPPI